jgi:hypothetical protein
MAVIAARIQPATNVESPIWSRPLIALDAIGFYMAQLVAPVHLVSDYGRTPEYVLGHWAWPPYAAIAAGVVVLVVLMYRRWPAAAWSLAVFVGALLPVLGLTTFQFQWYTTVADRYAYLPLAMALPVLGILVARGNTRVLVAAGIVAVVAMGVRSEYAIPVWKDTMSWAEHQIKLNPRSSAGYRVLAEHYVRAEDEKRGEELYLKCLELRPNDTIVLYNLGNMRLRQGEPDAAMDLYLRAIKADSRNLGVYNNGFIAAQKTGRMQELGQAIAGTLGRNERNAYAHSYMGWVYMMDGDAISARPEFERALELAPGLASARNGMRKIIDAGVGGPGL